MTGLISVDQATVSKSDRHKHSSRRHTIQESLINLPSHKLQLLNSAPRKLHVLEIYQQMLRYPIKL